MLDIQKKLSNSFFVLLSLPSTAMGFALSVQIAALSWILNTRLGFNLEQIGLVWLSGPLAGILGQVIIGVVSDGVWFWGGRRRPFIFVGGLVAALMLLALPNIDIINSALGFENALGIAIAVALSLDLAINISFNPTRSIIADVTPAGVTRTKGYTWMQTISGFFGVLAYLVGAFINNYVLIYFGAVLVFLFSIVPTLFIQEPRQLGETGAGLAVSTETDWNRFLRICLAHAFTWLGVQTMFVYAFGYIKEIIMGFPMSEVLTDAQNNRIGFITGVAFAILNTVGFLLPATVLEPMAERIGRVRTHLICIALMAVGYMLTLMLATTPVMLFVCMAIVGIGWAAVVSLPFAIMSESVNQARMGLFMGLFNLSVVLPQLLASSLGGFINDQPDKKIIFVISAVALAISAVLWLLVRESQTTTAGKAPVAAAH